LLRISKIFAKDGKVLSEAEKYKKVIKEKTKKEEAKK
jgi:hypothetical protein